ncbi:uncharacterized protein LOC100881276 isoform X1 [Megachile rotundata]|uniref:uncharacterized protein LOC100881276 isoform X1 n=1 Tax=Megachile rotundata TaxID=143995 RepID=UPI003FD39E17
MPSFIRLSVSTTFYPPFLMISYKKFRGTVSLSPDRPCPIPFGISGTQNTIDPPAILRAYKYWARTRVCQNRATLSRKSKMAFKFLVLAAFVAVASAGGPAAYDISASSGDHSSVGFSQESTQKGYAGQNVVSSYTKSDDSAHSFVRVSSHSVSNDGLYHYEIPHTPVVKAAYAAPAYAAPAYAAAPAAPLIAKTYAAPYSYGAPLLAKSYAAPYSYSSPLLAKTYAAPAPIFAKAAVAAPLLTKTYAPSLVAKSYATPLLAKSYVESAPLLTKTYEYAAHAPVVAKSAYLAPAHGYAAHGYAAHGYAASIAPAPLLTKTYAAPLQLTKLSHEYAPQAQLVAPVAHTFFNGLGTSYSW